MLSTACVVCVNKEICSVCDGHFCVLRVLQSMCLSEHWVTRSMSICSKLGFSQIKPIWKR